VIFALCDYCQYRMRTGRFARDYRVSPMGGAFADRLPEELVSVLEPGDLLFLQTLKSFTAWLVMYLGRSEISHVASYVGERHIAHATFSGVRIEPIESIYRASLILPVRWPMPSEKRDLLVATFKQQVGRPYGWRPVLIKGLRILTGRDWPYFRWSFLFDAGVALTVCDLPFLIQTGRPVVLWLLPAYAAAIVGAYVLWRVRGLRFSEDTVKPGEFLEVALHSGASIVLDGSAVDEHS
jgi:hypothetical protein